MFAFSRFLKSSHTCGIYEWRRVLGYVSSTVAWLLCSWLDMSTCGSALTWTWPVLLSCPGPAGPGWSGDAHSWHPSQWCSVLQALARLCEPLRLILGWSGWVVFHGASVLSIHTKIVLIHCLLTLFSPGGGGGGGVGGAVDRRKNLHKGRVWCKLQDCIVRLFFIIIFYFIWITYMLIYATTKKKSYFHYKSLIKASRLLIFGTYILFKDIV